MKIKHLNRIKDIALYFLSSLIPMILSLISNPLIALNMSPEDYGIVGYYTSFNTLITPFVTFYLLHYYMKRYFEVDEIERQSLKGTILKALIYFSFLLAAISFIFLFAYTIYFNKETNISFFPYALLNIISIPLSGLLTLTLTDYKIRKKSKSYFNLSTFNGSLGIILAIILVVYFKQGAFGRLLATLICNLIIFIWCLKTDWFTFKLRMDWKVFKKAIIFCWPLTIAAMLGFFTNGYDRVYLERLGNISELGYYTVAIQITGYLVVFSTAVSSTFQPDIYEAVVKNNYIKASKYILINITFISIIVILFIILSPYVINILTAGKYIDSTTYARILSLSVISSIIYYSISQITIVKGYTKITLINKIIGTIGSITCINYFIDNYGFIGAAWGQVISHLIFLIGNLILVLIYYKLNPKRINL